MYLHVHVALTEREALCNVQRTRHMYVGTPHAREVVKGKLLLVTEDHANANTQLSVYTLRLNSLNGTYSVQCACSF